MRIEPTKRLAEMLAGRGCEELLQQPIEVDEASLNYFRADVAKQHPNLSAAGRENLAIYTLLTHVNHLPKPTPAEEPEPAAVAEPVQQWPFNPPAKTSRGAWIRFAILAALLLLLLAKAVHGQPSNVLVVRGKNTADTTLFTRSSGLLVFKCGSGLTCTYTNNIFTMTPSGGGSGTVTSIDVTVPAALLSISGCPITTSGTCAITLGTRSANTGFYGPTTGAAATPTFRSMVVADLVAHASTHQNGGSDEVATTTAAAGAIPKAGTDSKIPRTFMQFSGPLGLQSASGVTYKVAFLGSAPLSATDIYTAPAGKRAYISTVQEFNTAGTTTTLTLQYKLGGSTYTITAPTITTNAAGSVVTVPIVLEPTESVTVTASQAGLNVWVKVTEFDNTSPIYSPRLTSFSTGDNTVYTVPAAKSAQFFGGTTTGQIQNCVYVNQSGGARTTKWHLVPSGGSPGATNQMVASGSQASAAVQNPSIGLAANTGDFVVVNLDAGTATQLAWCNVMEQ